MAVRTKTGVVRVIVECMSGVVVCVEERANVKARDNIPNDREVIYCIRREGSVKLFVPVDGDEAASLRPRLSYHNASIWLFVRKEDRDCL